jgi:hypothetical protein
VKRAILGLVCAACASSPIREADRCDAPVDRVEVEAIQVGWNVQSPPGRPPFVDVRHPTTRDQNQAEELTRDLLDQCKKGTPMAPLQERFSEEPPGSQVIGRNSSVDYRATALCLQPDECAAVRGRISLYVIKRIR